MTTVLRLARRIRTLLNRTRVDDDIRRELEFHIAMETEERERRGLPPVEARRCALRDFGGVAVAREAIRDVRGITVWDALAQDVRFALRTLRRWRGHTAATLLTLSLGIGANTAIFSIVNDVLLRPLPYRDGNQLVRVVQSIEQPTEGEIGISIKEFQDYRAGLESLERPVEYHSMSFVLLNHGEPDRVETGVVSPDFFEVFGIRPLYGRTFTETDDDPGAPAVLILSHGYWQARFGADPAVVGRQVQMNDRPHTVVGVLPPIPQYPRENDVYMPTSACPFRALGEREMDRDRRAFSGLRVFARLKAGADTEGASAEVAALSQQFADAHPAIYQPQNTQFSSEVVGLNEEMVENARPILLALLGTTALILLIACANVANLSLARLARRDREMAVRLALGAGRGRLMRQLLTESSILACASGALGLLVAAASADLLARFASRLTPRVIDPSIDWTVFLFTVGLSLATGLIFGIVPAFFAKPSLTCALKDGGAHGGDGPKTSRLRGTLVVAQVAVCFALLVGAGLFLDTLRRLVAVDPGYRADRVLTAEVFSNWSRHHDDAGHRVLYSTMLERLKGRPGVVSAAVTNAVPLSDRRPFEQPVRIEGISGTAAQLPLADQNVASEEYFAALGIPVLKGRTFNAADHQDAPLVAVINASMARFWGDRDPVGGRFQRTGSEQWLTVIGVVGDVRQFSLARAVPALYYTPFLQTPGIGARVLVSTDGDPMQLVPDLKAAVFAADPEMPVERIQTLAELRSNRLASPGLNAIMLAIFAAVALVITLAGIAAVVGTSVSQRTREFGVRIALGASRGSVLRMVLQQGLALTSGGVAAGAFVALLFAGILRAYLYETRPTDPVIYLVVAAVFVTAAALACLAPARRATAIDPLFALKVD